jgi:hypothetical protein
MSNNSNKLVALGLVVLLQAVWPAMCDDGVDKDGYTCHGNGKCYKVNKQIAWVKRNILIYSTYLTGGGGQGQQEDGHGKVQRPGWWGPRQHSQ